MTSLKLEVAYTIGMGNHDFTHCELEDPIWVPAIWHLIFLLACILGSTGRSLSLVSTHFREISAPFKYRSIAITHWSQIIALLQASSFSKENCHGIPFCSSPLSLLGCKWLSKSIDEQSQSKDDLESSEESEDIQEIRGGSALPECNDGDDVIEA
jgi:hypothetical protein